MHEALFNVPVAAPFRLDLTVWVLRRREKNTIDRWDGRSYFRVLVVDGMPIKLTATQIGTSNLPQLSVTLQSHKQLSLERQTEVRGTLQKMLGLNADLQPFYVLSAQRPELDRLTKQFIGVRPPCFPTVFEALVNAVACQQLSLDAGIFLLNHLSRKFGKAYTDDADTVYAFPEPEDVSDIPEKHIKQLGFSYQKARAIRELAHRVINEDIRPEQLMRVENEQALSRLQSIRGIGRWSAEYVLLRGLGRLDVFPGDDIGGQANVQKLLQLAVRPDYEHLRKLTAVWQPYAGLIYFHLLLSRLHEKGLV